MEVSDFDKDHVGEIMQGMGTWFTADLMRLMGKADIENRRRLAEAFPEVYVVWSKWFMQKKGKR